MTQLNYHHLQYFFTIAREGSIVKAAERLHLSPQTLSGQLKTFEDYLGIQLFDRRGKRLLLNETGKTVYSYAEDIFSLGRELQQAINSGDSHHRFIFTVGIVDVIPKIMAFDLLSPTLNMKEKIQLISKEGSLEALLAELALNKIDLIISDRPLPPGSAVKAYSHALGESGLTFYAEKSLAQSLGADFPRNLDRQPMLLPGENSSQKVNLLSWLDANGINPTIVAEFDDSAQMKYFGQFGYGVFCTPTTIEPHVLQQYEVSVVGRTQEAKESFYAISPERKLEHPAVKQVIDVAKALFAKNTH